MGRRKHWPPQHQHCYKRRIDVKPLNHQRRLNHQFSLETPLGSFQDEHATIRHTPKTAPSQLQRKLLATDATTIEAWP
eukprot:5899379-Amphidinium_carterae.1